MKILVEIVQKYPNYHERIGDTGSELAILPKNGRNGIREPEIHLNQRVKLEEAKSEITQLNRLAI